MHLSTEEPAASWMLELFGEVGGDVSECFSLGKAFSIYDIVIIYSKKVVLKT